MTLTRWRRERDAAIFTEAGSGADIQSAGCGNEKLRRQNQRLQEELRKAEIIIDVQKTVAMLLGRPLPPLPDGENS